MMDDLAAPPPPRRPPLLPLPPTHPPTRSLAPPQCARHRARGGPRAVQGPPDPCPGSRCPGGRHRGTHRHPAGQHPTHHPGRARALTHAGAYARRWAGGTAVAMPRPAHADTHISARAPSYDTLSTQPLLHRVTNTHPVSSALVHRVRNAQSQALPPPPPTPLIPSVSAAPSPSPRIFMTPLPLSPECWGGPEK
jgi:hypothetical protein